MIVWICILGILGSLLFGFLLSHTFVSRYAVYRRIHRRVALKMLKDIGGKSAEELLTSNDPLVREYGTSLHHGVSSAFVTKMWKELAEEEKLDRSVSDEQFWLRISGLILSAMILGGMIIAGSILLYNKMYLDAGFKIERVPEKTFYHEVWTKENE